MRMSLRNRGRLISLLAPFSVGFVGVLAGIGLRVEDGGVWLLVAAIGAAAGLASRGWPGMLAVCLGIVATYPVAISLGLIAFLGDGWPFYLTLILILASVSYAATESVLERVRHSWRRA
jgi:hypothetical protein